MKTRLNFTCFLFIAIGFISLAKSVNRNASATAEVSVTILQTTSVEEVSGEVSKAVFSSSSQLSFRSSASTQESVKPQASVDYRSDIYRISGDMNFYYSISLPKAVKMNHVNGAVEISQLQVVSSGEDFLFSSDSILSVDSGSTYFCIKGKYSTLDNNAVTSLADDYLVSIDYQ